MCLRRATAGRDAPAGPRARYQALAMASVGGRVPSADDGTRAGAMPSAVSVRPISAASAAWARIGRAAMRPARCAPSGRCRHQLVPAAAAMVSTETPFGLTRDTLRNRKPPRRRKLEAHGTLRWPGADRVAIASGRSLDRHLAVARGRPSHRAPAARRRNRHRARARTDCRRPSPCCGPPGRRPRAPPAARGLDPGGGRSPPWSPTHRCVTCRRRPFDGRQRRVGRANEAAERQIAFIGGAHDQRAAAEIAGAARLPAPHRRLAHRGEGLKCKAPSACSCRSIWPAKWLFKASKPPWKTLAPMPSAMLVGLFGGRRRNWRSIRHRCGCRR